MNRFNAYLVAQMAADDAKLCLICRPDSTSKAVVETLDRLAQSLWAQVVNETANTPSCSDGVCSISQDFASSLRARKAS